MNFSGEQSKTRNTRLRWSWSEACVQILHFAGDQEETFYQMLFNFRQDSISTFPPESCKKRFDVSGSCIFLIKQRIGAIFCICILCNCICIFFIFVIKQQVGAIWKLDRWQIDLLCQAASAQGHAVSWYSTNIAQNLANKRQNSTNIAQTLANNEQTRPWWWLP